MIDKVPRQIRMGNVELLINAYKDEVHIDIMNKDTGQARCYVAYVRDNQLRFGSQEEYEFVQEERNR